LDTARNLDKICILHKPLSSFFSKRLPHTIPEQIFVIFREVIQLRHGRS
jgi:hypothetical protein